MRKLPLLLAPLALASAISTLSDDANAFSTRVHIMIANKVRDAAITGDGTITLWQGGYSVQLSAEDKAAIINQPEAFRAGAIGPDNMVFPGMTDPSHAIRQRPFEQCQVLYDEAILEREKAYALGCFLHGSTDAIAHHYVNYMSGETFTLTPITEGRQRGFSNVVRHIIAEEMIQDAANANDPSQFTSSRLTHTIPKGFVLRTYFDLDNPVYGMMGANALEEYNDYIVNNPGSTLFDVITGMDVAPADHLVLLPVYVREIDGYPDWLRAYLESEIATMQDWNSAEGSDLQVTPGLDGIYGTSDDDTACSVGCASTYAKYFVYVGLLEDRYDAGGNVLPPAYDKVSDKFRVDLQQLMPALLDSIENVSNRLNTGLDVQGGGIGDITQQEIEAAFEPMTTWADDITTIDSQSLAVAVSPQWLQDMQAFFQAAGINIDVAAYIQALLDPLVQPIRDAIRAYVLEQAKAFINDLTYEYQQSLVAVRAEYQGRLEAALPAGAPGPTALDNFYETGLYGHAFNISAVAFADHRAVLPVGTDPVGIGPASFDCSHTPKWMQVGACDYLAQAVFPLGMEVDGSIGLILNGQQLRGNVNEDSPVECHEGSLFSFSGDPRPEVCALVTADELNGDPLGTVSRAVPPDLSPTPVTCTDLTIAGLPLPPEGTGGSGQGGSGAGSGGGASTGGTGSGTGGTGADGDGDGGDDDGCSCRLAGAPSNTGSGSSWGLGALGLGLGIAVMARRRASRASRARRGVAAAAAIASLAAGCSDDSDGPPGTGGSGNAGGTPSDGGSANSTGGTTSDGGMGVGGMGSTTTNTTTTTTSTGQGGNPAQDLLDALDGTSWNAVLNRDGRDRAYELTFDGQANRWAEIRNPFGPARIHKVGEFVVESDGRTVQAVDDDTGQVRTWDIELFGTVGARTLRLTEEGTVEDFAEGYWPYPTTGLTAEVRVFKANGIVDNAYCKASSFPCSIDYDPIFRFARGENIENDLGKDIVAGAPLRRWYNVANFTTTDVLGFDFNYLGGTELSDQFNFVVRYTGWVEHPGGALSMRERDDDVGEFSPGLGGVWAFLGNDVGTGGFDQLFLGVNAFGGCTEGSVDEPVANVTGSGYLPIEIIMIRCNTDGPYIDTEMSITNGPFLYVGDQPTEPDVSETLFPFPL